MKQTQPPPVFEVVFQGVDIYPEAIPMRALSDSLAAVQRLATGDTSIVAEDTEEEEEKVGIEDESIRLVGIRRGSARYLVSGPQPTSVLPRLRLFGQLLEHPENVEAKDDFMLAPLERLSGVARRLDCTIIIRESGKRGGPALAKIVPTSFESLSRTLLVHGETSLTGMVVRVGGATALKCGLRVSFQKPMLICNVHSKELARKIGDCLYEEVVANGGAIWLKSSWRLYSFTIKDIQQTTPGSILDAMKALREAGGRCWDNIEDPAAYLEGVSNDL